MGEPRLIRVVIVDDHPMAQAGTRHFLNAYPDMELVGVASSGEEALTLCQQLQPDVVLMDVVMPGMDGIAATKALKQAVPATRVIIVTSFGEADVVQRALQAGARGYLLKNATASELVQAVRNAYQGRPVMAHEATEALMKSMSEANLGHDFTEREREVLALLAQGLSNLQIAERLFVSAATVKFHIGGIFAKLGVATRAEAIALAYQKRLV